MTLSWRLKLGFRGAQERRSAEAPSEPLTGMRHAIAMAMARSNREIPHYYLSTQIDMSKALNWLEQFNQQRSIENRVLPVALLLKAVARGLVQVPELNGFWIDDQLKPSPEVHLGVAISLRRGGLIIPAIHAAHQKSVEELMAALRDVITRARSGRLHSSEITEGTITVTNLGDLGVETVYGVIYPPQVALVGFGRISGAALGRSRHAGSAAGAHCNAGRGPSRHGWPPRRTIPGSSETAA